MSRIDNNHAFNCLRAIKSILPTRVLRRHIWKKPIVAEKVKDVKGVASKTRKRR
jgi:hypothetical protein